MAQTKQMMPRKEWKELKKQEGVKTIHTSAVCFASNGDVGASPAYPALSSNGEMVGQCAPHQAFAGFASLLQSGLLPGIEWGSREGEDALESGFGTDSLSYDCPGGEPFKVEGVGETGRGVGPRLEDLSLRKYSPLNAVLGSHLSQLGPTACSVLERPRSAESMAR